MLRTLIHINHAVFPASQIKCCAGEHVWYGVKIRTCGSGGTYYYVLYKALNYKIQIFCKKPEHYVEQLNQVNHDQIKIQQLKKTIRCLFGVMFIQFWHSQPQNEQTSRRQWLCYRHSRHSCPSASSWELPQSCSAQCWIPCHSDVSTHSSTHYASSSHLLVVLNPATIVAAIAVSNLSAGNLLLLLLWCLKF